MLLKLLTRITKPGDRVGERPERPNNRKDSVGAENQKEKKLG